MRVTLTAFLDKVQISIPIDSGFGDTITPGPTETDCPIILDLPSPHLLAYPHEIVISEKLEAIVKLGIVDTRMKDFHDPHSLFNMFDFDGQILAQAIRATFLKGGTQLPSEGTPLAFAPEFYEDKMKVKQSSGFCNKNKS